MNLLAGIEDKKVRYVIAALNKPAVRSDLIYKVSGPGIHRLPAAPLDRLIKPVIDHTLAGNNSGNGFDSRHPGVVFFCYADGSVHPIAKDITIRPLVALGGINNGVVTPEME